MPVASLATPVGGHVCKKVTAGSRLIGDSASDYLLIVGQCAFAAATAGAGGAVCAAGTAAAKAAGLNALDMVVEDLGGEQAKQIKDIILAVKSIKDVSTPANAAKVQGYMKKAAALVK